MVDSPPVKIIAPAKINLFLHLISKREDGYHNLQSLVTFANFGDTITITPNNEFKFSFESTSENMPTNENNLVICAANLLADALHKDLNLAIHLTKNIPIGAGLGGGSSDAAATIKGLLRFWNEDINQEELDNILLDLGADVPACYYAQPCYFEGIGEIIKPVQSLPTLHAVIIHPNKHCSTKEIFEKYDSNFSNAMSLPENFNNSDSLIEFLKEQTELNIKIIDISDKDFVKNRADYLWLLDRICE